MRRTPSHEWRIHCEVRVGSTALLGVLLIDCEEDKGGTGGRVRVAQEMERMEPL
jgi:hypothetical protein